MKRPFTLFGAVLLLLLSVGNLRAQQTLPDSNDNAKASSLRFYIGNLSDSTLASSLGNALVAQYAGKIISWRYEAAAPALDLSFSKAIQVLDVLQILRMNGYEAWYYIDATHKGFLDASGESVLSEHIKQ